MSDQHWLTISTYCGVFGVTLSTISNITLLTLLKIRPSKAMGSYKYLIATFCIFSIFYTSIEFFLRPLIHIYDNTMFVLQRKRFDYSSTVARSISSTYCGCYAMSFILFAVHFVYRYFASCKPHLLRTFEGHKFIFWVSGSLLLSASWGGAAFLLFPETERTYASFVHVVTESYGLDPYWVGYVPYSYYRTAEDGSEYLNPYGVIGVIQHSIIMAFSFGAVFYCGFATHRALRANTTVSDKTRELQNQLFKALIIQTVIPMLFMYIPITVNFMTPFSNLSLGAYANIPNVAILLYPGVDPMVLLLVIKDYRRTLIRTFCCNVKLTHVDSRSSYIRSSISQIDGKRIFTKTSRTA